MRLRRTAKTHEICEIHTYGCDECGVWTAAEPTRPAARHGDS
jgi:hypothetical protein